MDKHYGVLFGAKNLLKYFSFEDKKIYLLQKVPASIWDISTTENEVIYGTEDKKIRFLFNSSEYPRGSYIKTIQKHREDIFDGGSYGLYNSLENRVLIHAKDMRKMRVQGINSLISDHQNLYAIVWDNDWYCHFIKIKENSGNYFLGETIKSYNNKQKFTNQAIIIPYGSLKAKNGEVNPFSIISCVYLRYLDINGERIEGSGAGKRNEIRRIGLLGQFDHIAEVIFSGWGLTKIIKAKINLKEKKVLERENLTSSDGAGYICAFKLVKNNVLHQKLINSNRI